MAGDYADRMEKNSEQRTWEPMAPLPLNEDGSSIIALLGSNPEVHYIYICTKVSILFSTLNILGSPF